MGTTSDKLARIITTKTALATVITNNGGTVPAKFREYPDALSSIITGDTNLNNATINLSFQSVNWKPETSFTPIVEVICGNKVLTKDTDYTVSYSNNNSVGIATVTITGKGLYKNTKTATFTINPCNLSNLPDGVTCNIILSKQIYNPEDQPEETGYYKPAINSVTLSDTTLTPTKTTTLINGIDYQYGYSNNTGPGIGKCTITGTGNYSGEAFTQFQIVSNNFTDIDSFVSILEDGDFTNFKVGTTTITGNYIKDDSSYVTASALKLAVNNGSLVPGSLQWTLIGVNTTPPEYVKYRKGTQGNYEYCWIKPTMTTSGITDNGTSTFSRTWGASSMEWAWTSTGKTIVSSSATMYNYAENSSWGVPMTITDSDGVTWNFCGYTATFRTTYLIESRSEKYTEFSYRSSGSTINKWETSYVYLWLNSKNGSDEITYYGDRITSHGGFTLRLYNGSTSDSMKFLKNIVNSKYLVNHTTSITADKITLDSDRFYVPSYKEISVSSGSDDGIISYYSDNSGRKQYFESGTASNWWLRTPYVTEREEYCVTGVGDITTKSISGNAIALLPVCTVG